MTLVYDYDAVSGEIVLLIRLEDGTVINLGHFLSQNAKEELSKLIPLSPRI